MKEFFSVFPGEWEGVNTDENLNFKTALDALLLGNYQEAADLCDAAVESAGEDAIGKAKALSLKASFDILKGDIDTANYSLSKSLKLNKNDPNVLIKIALVHLEKNDFIEMTRALETSYNLNRANPALFYHRGEVLALSGSLEAAVKDFEEAEKCCPIFEISYVHHSRGLLGLNRPEEAERLLIKVLGRFKDSVEIRNALGEVYVWKQDFRLAEKTFNDILASKPNSPQVQLNLSLLKMTENNNTIGAEEHLKKALEIDPTFEAAHLQLANLMISAGRNEEAMNHFENAIKHARSLQELTSVYSLKLASQVQLVCIEKFPNLAEKIK
jgi:import receptor subunit TOM70